MECKDCENYKQKEKEISDELKLIFKKSMHYCENRFCSSCEMDSETTTWGDCPINKLWSKYNEI